MCPTLGPAGTVLFTRVTGSKEQVAVLDLATHKVTVRADLPLIPPGSGCPAWLGDPKSPNSFMFLGCKGDECDESVVGWPGHASPPPLVCECVRVEEREREGGGGEGRMVDMGFILPFVPRTNDNTEAVIGAC